MIMVRILVIWALVSFSLLTEASTFIHNNSGVEKTYEQIPIASGGILEVSQIDAIQYAESEGLAIDLASGAASMSKDGLDQKGVSESQTLQTTIIEPENQHFEASGFASKNVRDAIVESKDTVVGKTFHQCFVRSGSGQNRWIGNEDSSVTSSESPQPLPWDSTLVAMTFTNSRSGADQDVEVWSAPLGSGNSKTKKYDWQLNNNKRAAVKNDISIDFNAGDKVAIYIQDRGTNTRDPVVCLYFKIRTNAVKDESEDWSGDFSGGGDD